MILKIYSVYDKGIEGYMRPWFAQADGQALRLFIDEVDGDSPMAKHPEDYSLFRIGSFDDENGTITCDEVKCLARAHEVQTKKVNGDG